MDYALSGDVLVRHFTPSDLSQIVELESASFTTDAFSEALFLSYYQECPDLFFVAENTGIIVGYMLTVFTSSINALIVSIAVHPLYRRKGVGRTLANFTLNQLKASGKKIAELNVRTTNMESRNFWESLGFTLVTIIPDFYGEGEKALHMVKLLEGD